MDWTSRISYVHIVQYYCTATAVDYCYYYYYYRKQYEFNS